MFFTPLQHFVLNTLKSNPKKDADFKINQLTAGELKEVEELVANKVVAKVGDSVVLVNQ